MNCPYPRSVSIVMLAVLFSCQNLVAQETGAESMQTSQQAQRLKQQFARELAKLQQMEERLNSLADAHQQAEASGDTIRAMQNKYAYVQLKKEYDASLLELQKLQRMYKSLEAREVDRAVAQQLSQDNDREGAQESAAVAVDKTVRQAKPSHSVEALLQEEHALFNRRLTLEAGVTYSHSDRKQLVLNGFLALDAIFLGNIALEGVESDIFRYDLSARYGLTDRLNINLNVPFIQRTTNYQKGGADSSAIVGETEVTRDPTLGDASLGMSYQILREGPRNPDVVWNLSLTGPSGEHPYGVPTVDVPTNDPDDPAGVMQVPAELPTGSGVWTATTGASFVRTLDPAIIFANIAYSYTRPESFSDIQAQSYDQPGEIDLGDTWQYGVGIAFAFNDQLSMNMSYTQALTRVSKTRNEGEGWIEIIGSKSNSATLGVGVTYAMTRHLAMVTNVGAGLTADAPDLTFSVKFPYMF